MRSYKIYVHSLIEGCNAECLLFLRSLVVEARPLEVVRLMEKAKILSEKSYFSAAFDFQRQCFDPLYLQLLNGMMKRCTSIPLLRIILTNVYR